MSRASQSAPTTTVVAPGSGVLTATAPDCADARPLRADARRNRDRLLVVAAELFTERGVEVPLEEVARRAEVGIGTLYRHFPTRDALIEAVYRNELQGLLCGVDALIADNEPQDALVTWMYSFTRYVARKRGMAVALKQMLGPDNSLFVDSRRQMVDVLTRLLDGAAAVGAIRSDVEPDDLLRAMGGICMATDSPDWQDRTVRLVDLLMDGLRFGAANSNSMAR